MPAVVPFSVALLLAVAGAPTLPLVINLGLPKTGSTSLHECERSSSSTLLRFFPGFFGRE